MLNLCFSRKGLISRSGIQFCVPSDKYIYYSIHLCIFFLIVWQPQLAQGLLLHYRGFTITLRQTTFGRIPLVEWSARHKDLFLKTHNKRDGHSCPRRDLNPQSQRTNSAADPCLRPCGRWERLISAQWINISHFQIWKRHFTSVYTMKSYTARRYTQ